MHGICLGDSGFLYLQIGHFVFMLTPMLDAEALVPVPVMFPPEGVFVLESRHRKGFYMPEMTHDFWKFVLINRGAGSLVEGRRRRHLAVGDVIIVPPGDRHALRDTASAPLSLYAICVQPAFLGRTVLPFGGRITLYHHPIWSREFAQHLRSLLIEQSRPSAGSSAWITGLTWQIIGLIWRAGTSRAHITPDATPGTLARRRVAAYIQELPQAFHRETNIDDAAKRLGLGRRRFTHLFREIAGKSWLQTLQRLRLDHAQSLLRGTRRSVVSVAFESGFSDLSHFYRVFRQAYRSSPERWRSRHTPKLV